MTLPPPETTMENGIAGGKADSTTKKSKAEERFERQAESITKMFGTAVSGLVQPLVQAISGDQQSNTQGDGHTAHDSSYHQETRMMHSMGVLDRLQAQVDRITATIDESDSQAEAEKKHKRLKTLNDAMDKVFENLNKNLGDN